MSTGEVPPLSRVGHPAADYIAQRPRLSTATRPESATVGTAAQLVRHGPSVTTGDPAMDPQERVDAAKILGHRLATLRSNLMTADQSIRLVTAIAGLLGVLVWPALVVFLAVRFRAPLWGFLSNLSELSLKAPGLEATLRTRIEAAAALGAAMAKETPGGPTSFSTVADVLTEAVPDRRTQRRLQGRHVLWVDDRPNNNRYERQSLEALGVRFALSVSTDDALDQLRHQTFDLIISDMGRPPDAQAGYTLLDMLRAAGNHTPFVIYASSRSIEHVTEARRRGAQGCTNTPEQLFAIVSQILGLTHLGR